MQSSLKQKSYEKPKIYSRKQEPLYKRVLKGPTYDIYNGRLPTVKEVIYELIDAISFWRYKRCLLPFIWFTFHILTGAITVFYVLNYFSILSFLKIGVAVILIGTIFNTVWYHRYVSHKAFKFSHIFWAKLFQFLNPLGLRDETYCIPHYVHHSIPDQPGDPYGPHLGVLGNYLNVHTTQKYGPSLDEKDFKILCTFVNHIGIRFNSFNKFKEWGSIEVVSSFLFRTLFTQSFYLSIFYLFGGLEMVGLFYSAVFIFSVIMLDFNYRGHGGKMGRPKKKAWDFHESSKARNQLFYGYFASEWHDNHHNYMRSANSAFLSGQFDLAFQIIKVMKYLGIVKSFIDKKQAFQDKYLLDKEAIKS